MGKRVWGKGQTRNVPLRDRLERRKALEKAARINLRVYEKRRSAWEAENKAEADEAATTPFLDDGAF